MSDYILIEDHNFIEEAQILSEKISARIVNDPALISSDDFVIRFADDTVSLSSNGLTVCGNLINMLPRLKFHNLSSELLVKAAKFSKLQHALTAFDATAGLGEDSLLLSASGFQVFLFEHDPVIACLLRDSLRRALKDPELMKYVSHMHVIEGNSIEEMPNLSISPDLVYLDPMFPERQKSGLVKKKFQLLHHLEQPCANEIDLLNAAIQTKPRKIVVKRPLKGPFLADMKPAYSLKGKAIRYDCLLYPR